MLCPKYTKYQEQKSITTGAMSMQVQNHNTKTAEHLGSSRRSKHYMCIGSGPCCVLSAQSAKKENLSKLVQCPCESRTILVTQKRRNTLVAADAASTAVLCLFCGPCSAEKHKGPSWNSSNQNNNKKERGKGKRRGQGGAMHLLFVR